jgi:hypothetical protein
MNDVGSGRVEKIKKIKGLSVILMSMTMGMKEFEMVDANSARQ